MVDGAEGDNTSRLRRRFLVLALGLITSVWPSTDQAAPAARPAAGHTSSVGREPVRPRATEPLPNDASPTERARQGQPSESATTPTPGPEARNAFRDALKKTDATASDVSRALEELQAAAPGADVSTDVQQALHDMVRHDDPSIYDKIDYAIPHLFSKRPPDERSKSLADYLSKTRLQSLLDQPIDRSKLVLLPLIYSTDGKAKLSHLWSPSRRVPNSLMSKVGTLSQDTFDTNDFAGLKGKTVVVIGHVVGRETQQKFEIRRDDGSRSYLPLTTLEEAARTINFLLVPLGCETDEATSLGTVTKINDIDALEAFERATSGTREPKLRFVLADLSSEAITLSIDLSRLSDIHVVPIEEKDRDGRVYDGGPAPQPAPPPTAAPSPIEVSQAAEAKAPPIAQPTSNACAPKGPVSDLLSAWSAWLTTTGLYFWTTAFLTASAYAVVLAMLEVPFLPGMTVGDSIALAPLYGVAGALHAGGIAFFMNVGTSQSPDSNPLMTAFAAALAIGLRVKAKEIVSDQPMSMLGIRCLFPIALVPAALQILIAGARAACLIGPSA